MSTGVMVQDSWEKIRHNDTYTAVYEIRRIVEAAVEAERERCAKITEEFVNDWHNSEEAAVVDIFKDAIAARIRSGA